MRVDWQRSNYTQQSEERELHPLLILMIHSINLIHSGRPSESTVGWITVSTRVFIPIMCKKKDYIESILDVFIVFMNSM